MLRDIEVQRLQALLAQRTNELSDKEKALELTTQEIINLNSVLLSQSMHIDDLNATILALSGELANKENVLLENQSKYDILIAKLQEQKAKIKSLTGIKIKVIAELKQNLGKNIQIDPISGSLRLSSNILFDKGSAELKESSKNELKKVFINYVGALTSNKNIKNQLDKIIIEGHTDSDGTYLYNLDLSQKRAYAVMRYLLTLDFTENNNLKPLLLASGRADQDTIKDKKAQEDKELSRRIEIKFTLKNDDALHEIERILDYE
ncbi:MAG: hypothetical protein A2019_05570 [Sulfurimonas sp. GWF2_37_8]|nr:MAG: hypothetical protein A2019_05570 [Sulfurimonas sp. GWF2_37_8]